MPSIIDQVSDAYDFIVESGDPRSNRWVMVRTPISMITAVLSYLFFVWFVPNVYMKNRHPYRPHNLLLWYNIAMVLLCGYMVAEILLVAFEGGYGIICQPLEVRYDSLSMRMANVFWLFYVSKIIEFADTAFIVFRKKYNQLTFLHWYHHSSTIITMWIGAKFTPGGRAYLYVFANALVHCLMYTYYGLASFPKLRKYLWWKKYVTAFQIGQFVVIIFHVATGVSVNCPNYPHWTGLAFLCQCFFFTLLFSNFYINTYKKDPHAKPM